MSDKEYSLEDRLMMMARVGNISMDVAELLDEAATEITRLREIEFRMEGLED